jgi:hypothetical protein
LLLMNPFGGEPARYEDRSESLLKVADYFKAGEAKLEVVQAYASGDIIVLVMSERQHGKVGVCRTTSGRCASHRHPPA